MISVLKAGLYTTIQDHGRFFGAHLGFPISGPMDRLSAELANLTIDNNINDALLECTFTGPTLKFHSPTLIAINGAPVQIFINKVKKDRGGCIKIMTNDILSFGKLEIGCRFYIAIKGGIQSDEIYGSRSTCLTAGIHRPLKRDDQLSYISFSESLRSSISMTRTIGNTILDVSLGPEYSILSEGMQKQVFDTTYMVLPQSNRMATRVSHSLDLSHQHSMLSSGVLPGTIQLTPSGDIICLMRDTQTTGGYPRILQLTEEAICDLAQLMPNEKFTFRLV